MHDLDAIHAPRHENIQNRHVIRRALQQLQGLLPKRSFIHVIAQQFEQARQGLSDLDVVVHEKDSCLWIDR